MKLASDATVLALVMVLWGGADVVAPDQVCLLMPAVPVSTSASPLPALPVQLKPGPLMMVRESPPAASIAFAPVKIVPPEALMPVRSVLAGPIAPSSQASASVGSPLVVYVTSVVPASEPVPSGATAQMGAG